MLTRSILTLLCLLVAQCAANALNSNKEELKRVVRSDARYTELLNNRRWYNQPRGYNSPPFMPYRSPMPPPMLFPGGPIAPQPSIFGPQFGPQPPGFFSQSPEPTFFPQTPPEHVFFPQSPAPGPQSPELPQFQFDLQEPPKFHHFVPPPTEGAPGGAIPVLDAEESVGAAEETERINSHGFALMDGDHCGLPRPVGLTNLVAGGKPTDNHQQPWYVQIIIHNDAFVDATTYCGGTAITKEWVLSAAHCYDDMRAEFRARNTHVIFAGLHGTKKKVTVLVEEVILHPEYVPAVLSWEQQARGMKPGPYNDMALLKLKVQDLPDQLFKRIIPACLPSRNHRVQPNTLCKVMGHGFTNPEDERLFRMPSDLLAAPVRLTTNEACKDDVESQLIKDKITDHTICMRSPIQPCVGDSGGPLVCTGTSPDHIDGSDFDGPDTLNLHADGDGRRKKRRWFLCGVVSFAVSTDEHDTCGNFKSVVFGLVASQLDWIRKTVFANTPRDMLKN